MPSLEEVYQSDPKVGRGTLARLAGTTQYQAEKFLNEKRHPEAPPRSSPPEAPTPASSRLEVENRQLKQQVKDQQDQITQLTLASELLEGVSSARLTPPDWIVRPSSSKTHRAIATAVLTDTHFDEVVCPDEVGGVNAYNREIARLRLQEFFANTVRLGRDIFSGSTIEGLALPLAGDIVSGNIHEELAQTNAAAILDTCLFWSEEIAAGIEHLLTFYPQVFSPCVVGNHGRQTKKPRNKGKVRDNFDYLIYSLLARHFKDHPKVSFMIPDTSDCHYQIYGTRYCLTHGDQFRGGTGIAGALSPLLLGDARKRKRSTATNNSYDYMVLGHWHQDIDTCGIIACNALKGYDEYAFNCNFAFSEPTQSFWLTDSEKGRTLRAPIHVRSKAEDWRKVERGGQPVWLHG